MSLKDVNGRHLVLISTYASRYAVRSGTGIIFFLIVVAFGLVTASIILAPVEQAARRPRGADREISSEEVITELVRLSRPAVQWAIGGGDLGDASPEAAADRKKAERWAAYLLDENPAMLSAVLMIMIFSLPLLVALGAFNQFSGDVQSGGLRYLLLRSERTNIFFGRFLGASLYSIFVVVILMTIITLYLGLKLRFYGWGPLLWWSARGTAALALVTVPYVALCSWLSASIDSPFGSLAVSSAVIGAVPLFALVGRYTWAPAVYVNYLLPWGVQNYLLHPDPGYYIGAGAACLGYTAVFLTLGYRHFLRRDL